MLVAVSAGFEVYEFHIHSCNKGAEIEYEGEPGSALEPVNDAARQAKAKVAGKESMAATSTKII
ncbi:hypothetical protein ACSLO2_27380, partial [Escherichia coli]